jgi:hypothetical protein
VLNSTQCCHVERLAQTSVTAVANARPSTHTASRLAQLRHQFGIICRSFWRRCLLLDLFNLLIQRCNQFLQPRLYALDDNGLPMGRMELVAELGASVHKRIAMNQTLLQLVLDWR